MVKGERASCARFCYLFYTEAALATMHSNNLPEKLEFPLHKLVWNRLSFYIKG